MSPVYRKSYFCCVKLKYLVYLLLPSIEKRICSSIFISLHSNTSHCHQVLSVSCLIIHTLRDCHFLSRQIDHISNNALTNLKSSCGHWRATVWHLLPLHWNLHGHRSRPSVCHGLIFSLIKFTLPVSCTPSCDEWLIWLWEALYPRVGLVCMCVWLKAEAAPRWAVWVMALCQWEGERSTALLLHFFAFFTLCLFFFFFSKDHICFFCYLPPPLLTLSLLFCP